MATDWTICTICLDVIDNPKSLPCIHGFCLKCLEGHFSDKLPGDTVPCPLCRKHFKIPEDGLVGLQHHFLIQDLVDKRHVYSKSKDKELCEVCLDEGEKSEATVYCVDCNEKLCEPCSDPHRTMKRGIHQLKALKVHVEDEMIQVQGCFCDKHKDKHVELYCHECEQNICLRCAGVKHRDHVRTEILDTAETFREQMDVDDKQAVSVISAVHEQSEKVKQTVLKFQKTIESAENQVLEAAERIKRKVDEQVNERLEKLQSVEAENTKQADIVQEQLQLTLGEMESFHTYSRELLEEGKPSDITRAASTLHKRAIELLPSDVTSDKYCPPHVTFLPADVTELMNAKLIGNIGVYKTEYEIEGRILHSLPEDTSAERVCGVTFLDNRLYVLRAKSEKQVEIYDIDTYKLYRCLNVRLKSSMNDIIACAHNRCLYISGFKTKHIYKLRLSPEIDMPISKWPVNDVAYCLSLSDTHSVFVSCPRLIKEFSSKGNLLREVQLPQDIVSPWHSIQLSDGQFIVSHGDTHDSVHRVCVIGSDGQVVKSYGGPSGSGSQQIDVPSQLAVGRNGFVFAADYKNRRVLLLPPDLTYAREILSRDHLEGQPFRISLDVHRNRLYIAEYVYGSGRVLVVDV